MALRLSVDIMRWCPSALLSVSSAQYSECKREQRSTVHAVPDPPSDIAQDIRLELTGIRTFPQQRMIPFERDSPLATKRTQWISQRSEALNNCLPSF